MSLITNSVERIKTFFEQLKRKLYNSAGGARLTPSRTGPTLQQLRERPEYQFASNMSEFLQKILLESGTNVNKYLSEDGVFLVRCYPAGGDGELGSSADRIFEVSSQITYREL